MKESKWSWSEVIIYIGATIFVFAMIGLFYKMAYDQGVQDTTAKFHATEAVEETLAETPEPDTSKAAAEQAYQEFYVDHTWDGTFKEIDGHMVSIADDGEIMLDGKDCYLWLSVEPPWKIGGWVIGDISDRADIYVISDISGVINHWHLGEIVESFSTSNTAMYDYHYWQATVGLEDCIIGVSYEGGIEHYRTLNYKTGELTDFSAEEAAPYLPPKVTYIDVGPIPLDAETAERVQIAREAYMNGWDGEFAEISEGLWALINANGTLIFNNEPTDAHICLPEFSFLYYANNVVFNGSYSTKNLSKDYECVLYAKDGMLTVYTMESGPEIFELPEAGVHTILGSNFGLEDSYYWEEGGDLVTSDNDRVFAVAIKTECLDGTIRLDTIYCDLDLPPYAQSHYQIRTLSENITGASVYHGELLYLEDGNLYSGESWSSLSYWHPYGWTIISAPRDEN